MAMMGLMICLVIAQVVLRDFFNIGLPWADELARFCGLAMVFLAVPRLLFKNSQIALDLVPNHLPPRPRLILLSINELLILGFCGIMSFALYKFLLRTAKFSTPALGIPNLVYYAPAILGIGLLALVSLYRLFSPFERGIDGREPPA